MKLSWLAFKLIKLMATSSGPLLSKERVLSTADLQTGQNLKYEAHSRQVFTCPHGSNIFELVFKRHLMHFSNLTRSLISLLQIVHALRALEHNWQAIVCLHGLRSTSRSRDEHIMHLLTLAPPDSDHKE